jgi:uridine kinase
MKAALLIAGYLRSFKLNIPVIKEKILNKFDSVDVYIHVTKNEAHDDRYVNTVSETEDINFINSALNPTVLLQEYNVREYSEKAKNNSINHWLKYYKLNSIKKINEFLSGKYDVVIKYRPDLNLISDNIFTDTITSNTVYIPQKNVTDTTKLLNPDDKVVCDIFAYGDSSAMDQYFSVYEQIDQLINKYGPASETLLYYHLKNNNIKYELINIDYGVILSICNTIAICGDSGSGKTVLSNILKQYFSESFTLECDRYHRWERSDENWDKYTHLNPEANYIAKMNKDIFDLKIGKTVYQVDYDHKAGRFTEKQQIEKADNVIVCGLHSLYNNNESIYNLKIFVDTDDNLKKRWKLQRDVTERGYTVEKSIEQIKTRELDYQKYIYPQRNISDIVINFFTDTPFSVESIEEECNLYLRVLVNKKHPLTEILNQLTMNNIAYSIDSASDSIFNIITFKEFTDTDLLKDFKIKHNSFYDYIVFFILSLRTKIGA